MSRILKVVRLQLINKQTFVWVPLIVLGSALAISVAIYAMIPVDTPKYGGGGQAPLWYFFAMGLSALTLTFPFSQAMSITRRDFFLGTMVAATLGALLMAAAFLVGGWIEDVTNGWGVNGYVFRFPWLWEAGPLAAGLFYFALAMFFFVIGFTGATIYKRWGAAMTTVVSVGSGLILVALAFLVTRLELWGQVGQTIVWLGALGLTLWALVVIAVLMAISYLVLRRATP
ncbi:MULTISPECIES: hypothetical protein [Bacteria]|uniref:hypothetical protein n=1 Tax=Bacteria TaxID=2 RepID=UPI003C7DC2DC